MEKQSLLQQYKNEFALYRIRKKLLAVIVGLLALFAIFTLLLFYDSERKAYRKNMTTANEVMVNQMASLYEMYFRTVEEIAHNTAIRNTDLLFLNANERQEVTAKQDILAMLSSLSVSSPYIHSTYLYYEEDNLVYSSISMPYAIDRLENFEDKIVFEHGRTVHPYHVEPHLIETNSVDSNPLSKVLLMSYVVPITGRNGIAYLSVNINARLLYSAILRGADLGENNSFYIVNQNGIVIFHERTEYLFAPAENVITSSNGIVSKAYSPSLGYTFVSESKMPPLESGLLKYSLLVLIVLGVVFLFAILAVTYSTVPLHKMIQIAKNSNMRDFLIKENIKPDFSHWSPAFQKCGHYCMGLFYFALPS
ncbi:MAG: cache domain-containing protein, partial [Ruthenibacterium sp.]